MSKITAVAKQFFGACETGKGWEGAAPIAPPMRAFRRKPSRWQKFERSKEMPTG
jgi:hypothetical protein